MKATAKLNLSPSDCAIFEDAASGIKSAFTAGSTRIIAVGSKERLQKLTKLDGVILGIHDFTEISFEKLINF